MDPFSSIIVAIMRQAGLQVRLNNPNTAIKPDGMRKVMCVNTKNEKGMFLNNVINILGQDNPIQFILSVNNIEWKPGDFA